jgi:hypothetical protein
MIIYCWAVLYFDEETPVPVLKTKLDCLYSSSKHKENWEFGFWVQCFKKEKKKKFNSNFENQTQFHSSSYYYPRLELAINYKLTSD